MTPMFVLLALASILALVAIVLRFIQSALIYRPAIQTRLITAEFLQWVETFLWIGSALSLIAAIPHPATIVLVALFAVTMAIAHTLRYREECRSLNRWLMFAIETRTNLSNLLETFADGCRSRLARQAKSCACQLLRGEPMPVAARRSRLPLAAETLSAIQFPAPQIENADRHQGGIRGRAIRPENDRSLIAIASAVRTNQQFTYVVATVLLAWLIGMLVRSIIVPFFEDLADEFVLVGRMSHVGLDRVVFVGNLCVSILLIWLALSLLIRWLPLWLVRLVPWFGNNSFNRWRGEVLRTLARGMRACQGDTNILQCIPKSVPVPWVRSRCRTAGNLVESGTSLATALRTVKLITASEQSWLTIAEKNGTLPDAMNNLSADIERRRLQRWQIRMAWVVPLATVLVGVFVLAHAVFLFQFMFAMMSGYA